MSTNNIPVPQSPCSKCSCWVTESFIEPYYDSEGDEHGTHEVLRSWCDAPECCHEQEYLAFVESMESLQPDINYNPYEDDLPW